MTYSDWATLATIAGAVVALLALYLGLPGWRNQREANFDRAVRRALVGTDTPRPPTPENPSLMDMVTDLWSEQKRLDAVETRLNEHIADPYAHERTRA